MTKTEIRKKAMKLRKALTSTEIRNLSLQLLGYFSQMDFSEVKVIHIFLPIENKKEPDTFLFIDWIRQNKPDVTILVPRADFDTALMTNHVYTALEDLEKNVFEILEPVGGERYTGKIDLVLVPLLGFDLRGYRVGYGKGFYDRFLSGQDIKKVGLSLFEPVEEITDIDEYDVRMDICITPAKLYRFN